MFQRQFLRATLLGLCGLLSGGLLLLACGDGEGDEGSGSAAFCDLSCTMDSDCNAAIPDATCAEGFCDYPEVEPVECDADSTDPLINCGGMPDLCQPVDGFNTCIFPCMADADCLVATLECTGTDDNGGSFCLPVPPDPFTCTAGEACAGGLGVCNDAGDACTCGSDADCTAAGTACHMI